MTHIIGVHHEDQIMIFADSAVTHHATSMASEMTTFGEELKVEAGLRVSERAFKIIETGGMLLAFAGRLSSAASFVKVLRSELRTGKPQFEALSCSLRSHLPLSANALRLIVGIVDQGRRRLVAFQSDRAELGFYDVPCENLIQFGSSPIIQESLAMAAFCISQHPKVAVNGELRLVQMLATLQSSSSLENLIEHGIGGAYTAARLTSDGIHWQPLISYQYADGTECGETVITWARKELFTASSSFNPGTIGIGNGEARCTREMLEPFYEQMRSGQRDYYVLLHPTQRVVTIIQANRRKQGFYFGSEIEDPSPATPTFRLRFHPDVRNNHLKVAPPIKLEPNEQLLSLHMFPFAEQSAKSAERISFDCRIKVSVGA